MIISFKYRLKSPRCTAERTGRALGRMGLKKSSGILLRKCIGRREEGRLHSLVAQSFRCSKRPGNDDRFMTLDGTMMRKLSVSVILQFKGAGPTKRTATEASTCPVKTSGEARVSLIGRYFTHSEQPIRCSLLLKQGF